MSTNIFISHRHGEPDNFFAKELQAAIESEGYKVYIDFKNKFGEKWAKAVDDALKSCDVLVLLLSEESVLSEAVLAEVRTAKLLGEKNDGKPWILPIRIGIPFENPLPYEINIHVGGLQHAFWDGEIEPSLLIKQILSSLAKGHFEGAVATAQEKKQRSFKAEPEEKQKPQLQRPVSSVDPSFINTINLPGGAVQIDNSFYIPREADDEVIGDIQKDRALITICAARQMGKTSLLMRAAHKANEASMRVAFIDFLSIRSECFDDENKLWKAVARRLERDLNLPKFVKEYWDDDEDADLNLEDFAEATQIGSSECPTLIAMDEVDRTFGKDASNAFFSILRSIHSDATINPVWKNIRWILSGSTEPMFFIKDLYQSPFNIGFRVELRDFSETEVHKLAEKYHCNALDEDISKLYNLLHGHPYLTQLALYYDVTGKRTLSQIISQASTKGTLFREHLHRFHLQLLDDEELGEAFYTIMSGKISTDLKTIARLRGAGLVRLEKTKYIPRCKLYKDYFSKNLKERYK